MTAETSILEIADALGLPPEARVEARVPKKLLVEQGVPTSADKRAIQDGIDELQWLASCKPTTIGVPRFADDVRDYLEIAVVGCAFRLGAKVGRLIELIHRAIPYPVVLVASDTEGLGVSVAHKRHALNEAGKVVIERVVSCGGLHAGAFDGPNQAFIASLALALQPRRDLWTLYEGWLTRIEALNAARLNGAFMATDDSILIDRRRDALATHSQLSREVIGLRAKANREKQIKRRVDLNLQIQRLEISISKLTKMM